MDNTFNYQLTIQKLEEELSLYRNGTTGQELLDLIHEKDSEILNLKSTNENNDEKLRKLAKSSSDVLSRYTILQAESASLLNDKKLAEKLVDHCELDLKAHKEQIVQMKAAKEKDEAELSRLFLELSNRCADIDKLQQRCGALVTEKMEKTRSLEDDIFAKDAQLKLLTDANAKTNEKLLAQSVQISQHQKEQMEWESKIITLGNSLMTQTQSGIAAANKNEAELEDAKAVGVELNAQLQTVTLERDTSQKEVTTLTQQVSQAHQTFVTQQEHLNGVIEAKDRQINDMLQRVRSLEEQQKQWQMYKAAAGSTGQVNKPKQSKSPNSIPNPSTPKTRQSLDGGSRRMSTGTGFGSTERLLRERGNTYQSSVLASNNSNTTDVKGPTGQHKSQLTGAGVKVSNGSGEVQTRRFSSSSTGPPPPPTTAQQKESRPSTTSHLSTKASGTNHPGPGLMTGASMKPSRATVAHY